jgi:hypothetical protein
MNSDHVSGLFPFTLNEEARTNKLKLQQLYSKIVTTTSWSWTHCVDGQSLKFTRAGLVHEVQNKTDRVGTLCANRKSVPPN